MLSEEEIENDDFYRGYNARDKAAKEICKTCKYKNKIEQLESENQDLIEKLQEKEIKIDELEDRISLIETYYDISDLDEIVKNDI